MGLVLAVPILWKFEGPADELFYFSEHSGLVAHANYNYCSGWFMSNVKDTAVGGAPVFLESLEKHELVESPPLRFDFVRHADGIDLSGIHLVDAAQPPFRELRPLLVDEGDGRPTPGLLWTHLCRAMLQTFSIGLGLVGVVLMY